ncbi:Crp/Fnr family transcriptional regulator [Hydrogenophaga sp.]|jgi:CRP/FNR family cyclic AMP-dependent transcriptional regulator|uniref:Crp/Fnr family transcriptional regulator n=1 Tax=Hydrogenophaga sp. TaxID=1904254 RepID=UPI003F719398
MSSDGSAHPPQTSGYPGVVGFLHDTTWFGTLDADVRQMVLSRLTERTIRKNQSLSRHGERPLTGYFILSGLLTWSDTSLDGRTVSFANFTAGAIFGFGSMLNGRARAGNVVAVKSARVGCVPKDVFEHLLHTSIPFNHALMHDFNERLLWFRGNLMAVGAAATDLQVVRAIVSSFHPTLNPLLQSEVRMTQEQVASLSGVSRQRCNMAIKRLRAKGLIDTSYGGIRVLDLAALRVLSTGLEA